LKSDILPLIHIGSEAIHVPFHTTWAHEQVTESETMNKGYKSVLQLKDVLKFIS